MITTGVCISLVVSYAVFSIVRTSLHEACRIVKKAETMALDQEIIFLSRLQTELNNLKDCGVPKGRIFERLARLKREKIAILSESNIRKLAKVTTASQREWASLGDQIQFLARLETTLNESAGCGNVKKDVSERIVALRIRQSYKIAIGTNDSVCSIAGKVPDYFFVPDYVIETLRVVWDSGGRAAIYKVEMEFPPKEMLHEFSRYYANLGWKPLKYDLGQALKLGGLEGGWRKGSCDSYFWTQFWLNESADVINVNVFYYGQNNGNIVITYSESEQMRSALDYYYMIYGISDVEPRKEIVKRIMEEGYKFFPVRSIQQ